MRVLVAFNGAAGAPQRIEEEAVSDRAVEEVAGSVTAALSRCGHQVTTFGVGASPQDFLSCLQTVRPQVVFNLCETIQGKSRLEPALPLLLEWLGIPYTGNPPHALAIMVNKAATKAICRAEAIPTPDFLTLYQSEEIERFTQWPAILKPANEDASLGIDEHSVVVDAASARARFAYLRSRFGVPVLMEQYVAGRELNVAVLQDGRNWRMGINEIDYSGLPEGLPKIVTYAAKWIPGSVYYRHTPVLAPAPIDAPLRARLQNIARTVAGRFGLAGFFRVDFRVDAQGNPFVLEVNPNPDLSEDAGFAKALPEMGLTYDQAVLTLINSALEHHSDDRKDV